MRAVLTQTAERRLGVDARALLGACLEVEWALPLLDEVPAELMEVRAAQRLEVLMGAHVLLADDVCGIDDRPVASLDQTQRLDGDVMLGVPGRQEEDLTLVLGGIADGRCEDSRCLADAGWRMHDQGASLLERLFDCIDEI